MIETIEENETETQVELLNWEENFSLFCAINKEIEFFTEQINYNAAAATYNDISLKFWNERLTRLVSVKAKLRKGIQVDTSTIKYFS
jgi:hypothetical protein